MKRAFFLTWFGLCSGLLCTACGSSAASSAAGLSTSDSVSGTDTAGGDASAKDSSTGGPDTAASDSPTTNDTAAPDQGLPAGDHFCLHSTTSAAVEWIRGWNTACVLSVASPPPMTATLKATGDYACTFYDETAKTPASCPPKEDMIGYCLVAPNPAPGLKSWRLLYKSKILPDTDALSLNLAASGCLTALTPDGKPLAARKCSGTVTAKVNGVAKDFSSKLTCTYKNDGTKAAYFVEADTAATDRLQFYLLQENGKAGFGTDDPQTAISKGAAYLEGGSTPYVTPVDAAARTFTATKFAEKGAGLTATFSLGDYKSGKGDVRTITDGKIDIKFDP